MHLQQVVNVLLIAHCLTLEAYPPKLQIRFNPLPSKKPKRGLKFRAVEQRRALAA